MLTMMWGIYELITDFVGSSQMFNPISMGIVDYVNMCSVVHFYLEIFGVEFKHF